MHAKPHSQSVDLTISALARRQHGVLSRWQLLEMGVSREQVAVRLRARRLVAMHRGVYLLGAVAPPYANEMAALLAYRLNATLSDWSAAALWDLLPYPATSPVWITVPSARNASRPGIQTRRATLDCGDVRRKHGMALTSPPRTILDCAAVLPANRLEALVAEAHYRRLASEKELCDQIKRNPGKRGILALRSALELPGGPMRTRSPAERWLLALLRSRGITGFRTNVRVAGYEVDFYWRDARLAVEVDGYDAHSGRVAFERDRLKAANLKAHGVSVMPVTGRQIRTDPNGVISRLSRALAL